MPSSSYYTTGWMDTSVHDFLSTLDEPSSSMGNALVTCVDSCFDLPSLLESSDALQSLRGKYQIVGQGALFSTRQLLAAERRQRIFFGFDEIWFFDNRNITAKPKDLVIVGPQRITAALIERWSEWLQSNGCSLGIGDGVGMNFCAKLRGVGKHLVEAMSEWEEVSSQRGS